MLVRIEFIEAFEIQKNSKYVVFALEQEMLTHYCLVVVQSFTTFSVNFFDMN